VVELDPAVSMMMRIVGDFCSSDGLNLMKFFVLLNGLAADFAASFLLLQICFFYFFDLLIVRFVFDCEKTNFQHFIEKKD